ncbi:MAG: hypothetical protein ACKVP0_18840 [Pirellulaceae bacterium]
MITNLFILLFFMFGPLALGAALWALGKPKSRWRVISRVSLLTLMLTMIPLCVVFAFVRPVVVMDEFARNITLVCLSRVAPILLPAMWLIYYVIDEWRSARVKTDQASADPKFDFLGGADEHLHTRVANPSSKMPSLMDRLRTSHEAPQMPVKRDYFGLRR